MPEWNSNLVSVIMPAYNCQAFLKESVSSVIEQTYPGWELLIVNDASTDDTLPIARRLAATDSRIRVISLEKNGGVANARNVGVAAANGRYVAFLDSDDLWLPEKLNDADAFHAEFRCSVQPSLSTAASATTEISANLFPSPEKVSYNQLLRGNVIGCLTVVIDRTKVPDPSMPAIRHEDYVTWLRILRSGNTAFGISQDLARYRVGSGSVSADKKRAAAWTWNIYRNIEGLSLARSSWFFLNYFVHAIYVRCAY